MARPTLSSPSADGAFAPPVGAHNPQAAGPRPFALARWFGGLALGVIAVIAAASGWLLGWFVAERALAQEGRLTRDFVQSVVAVEQPLQDYFLRREGTDRRDVEEAFYHFARMPDVLRANVYDGARQVLWSSDAALIGRRFGPNDELDEALAGRVVVERKTGDDRAHGKAEYEALARPDDQFVEIYVPVRDPASGRVVGAIELYKNPRELMASIADLRRWIAFGALASGLLLFLALYGLVRRADGLIQAQQQRLVENETFAVVGEMASVVAHGIRNPLAAMRSSAELIQDSPDRATAEAAHDIVQQADRLSAWVRELLQSTRLADQRSEPRALALAPLVDTCLQEFAREFERRRVHAQADSAAALPAVRGDALAVGQVLRSLVANALEAVPDGGRIALRAAPAPEPGRVWLQVQDNGPGLGPDELRRVGKPFFTTKAQGMGVGLALARRVLHRHGGTLAIDSAPGRGTLVTVSLCVEQEPR